MDPQIASQCIVSPTLGHSPLHHPHLHILDTSLATNQHDYNPEGGVSRPEGEHCVGMMNVTKESMWIINY